MLELVIYLSDINPIGSESFSHYAVMCVGLFWHILELWGASTLNHTGGKALPYWSS